MQTDILYKQLTTKLNELKVAMERFEKHTPPSTTYAEQLHVAINEANKLVSAYVVLKEQKDLSPDLNLHLKLMNVDALKTDIKAEVKTEVVAESLIIEVVTQESVVLPKIEVKTEPVIIEPKPVAIIFEKPEVKTYPKLAININDKFRIINELFSSNANEYHIAIEQLNTVNSMDEATAYIKGLSSIYNWKPDHEMVKNIQGLIQKRFM